MQYVALEGIPGAGKTNTVSFLNEKLKGAHTLSEHIISEESLSLFTIENPNNEDAYRLNWIIKNLLVELFDYKEYIITDRCFITAIAYNYSLSRVTGDPIYYEDTLAWARENILNMKLKIPDLCIVLMSSPSLSNRRKDRLPSDEMLWSQSEALKYAHFFYESILPGLDDLYVELKCIDSNGDLYKAKTEALHAILR